MKRFSTVVLLAALLLAVAPGVARAQEAAATSVNDEALRLFDDAANKLMQLAEAVPAEKYTWRPADGVRSVSEVFLHVAAGNFNIPRRLGTQLPEGVQINREFENSTTEKAKVMETLKQSIEHVRKAYAGVSDVEKTAPWFGGRQATMREIMFFIAMHEHEHLGQMIAYARTNGIKPPWSQ